MERQDKYLMEVPSNAYRSLSEAMSGGPVLHTEARPVGPSRITPETILDTMQIFGLEAAKLAIQQCFGHNNAEAEAALKNRFIEPSMPSIETA